MQVAIATCCASLREHHHHLVCKLEENLSPFVMCDKITITTYDE